ncbi:putative reverse transcriptase domain-containing protein [Tanacetum coccineum]
MAPRGRPTRTTRSRPVTATPPPVTTTPPPVTTTPPPVTDPTTTTSVTSAQLQAMIDEGVTAVLAARATTRNGDDSHTSGTGVRRNERTVRECTYQDFMKCQPLFFKGTEGVVSLTQWFERMETVFRIKKIQLNIVRRNEIKKVEAELWNLKVQGTDVVAYNQRFQELALLSDRLFPEETDKIERYVGGLTSLAERQTENTEKFEAPPRNNQNQPPNKRHNTGRAYAAGNGDRKPYEGAKPRCPKCNFNHYGPCTPTCTNCKKLGHLAKDCHFRNNCPQWKNKNQGNGNGVARLIHGVAGQNPDQQRCDGPEVSATRISHLLAHVTMTERLENKTKKKATGRFPESSKHFPSRRRVSTNDRPKVRIITIEVREERHHRRLPSGTRYGHYKIQKLCSAPILALYPRKRRFYRILRCFKEGFGHCVDAKRKGRQMLLPDALKQKEREPTVKSSILVMTKFFGSSKSNLKMLRLKQRKP